jgi:hypothetical protein
LEEGNEMSTINGDDGPNILISLTEEDDIINGFGGDDVLGGGIGNDLLDAGSGNDTLSGGAGIDVLTGGTGADTFQDTAANLNGDEIRDFLPGDRIQITDLNLNNANLGIDGNHLTFGVGQSVTIDNLGPGRLVLRGIDSGGVEIRLQAAANNDFNGDGRSDVLWQNTNGTVRDWLGQEGGAFAGNIAKVNILTGPEWHAVGTGDFNGDGAVDILWQHDNGTVRDWLGQADGSFVGNIDKVNILTGPEWHVVGTGDFNGDGRADILWQHDNGTVRDWLGQADGSFVGNIDKVNILTGPEWHAVGTGDFNGDGLADVLWQHDNGTVRDWLGQADGSFVGNIDKVNINTGAEWHVVGTGDFNGDGLSDVLWRHDNGTVREWLGQSDGSFKGNIDHVNFVPNADWHIVGIGDYDGDVIDDLLWQTNDGTVIGWRGQADGSFVDNSANVNIHTGTEWQAQDPFVHDPFNPFQ